MWNVEYLVKEPDNLNWHRRRRIWIGESNFKKPLVFFLIFLIISSSIRPFHSEELSSIKVLEDDDKVTFQSDVMTVEILGSRPVVTFYYTGDTYNYTHFSLSLNRVYEYGDDVAISVDVRNLPWAQTDPLVILDDVGEEIGYRLRLVLFGAPQYQFGIIFEVSMYLEDMNASSIGAQGVTYDIAGFHEFSIHVVVWNWTFTHPGSGGLALEYILQRDIPGETTKDHSSIYQQFEDTGLIQIIGVESELDEGFCKWSNNALVTYSDQESIMSVESSIVEEEGSDYVSFKYGRYRGILQHYQSIGVVEENAEFIIIPRPETINLPIVILTGVSALVVLVVAFLRKPPRED
jgi:hypothetical protein